MNIGRAIKQVRNLKNITQLELAEMCGLTQKAICGIEKSKALPRKETIAKISEALGIQKEFLLVLSIDEQDVSIEKMETWLFISKIIKELILENIYTN